MKEVICVDFRLVEVMVVKVSWFLKVILNCSVRVSVTTVFLKVNILQNMPLNFGKVIKRMLCWELGIPAWYKIYQLSIEYDIPINVFIKLLGYWELMVCKESTNDSILVARVAHLVTGSVTRV